MKKTKYLLQLLLLLFSMSPLITYGKSKVVKMVCEYHTNPIGIDAANPRLSWQIFSDEDNIKQTAFEIRVANSLQNLSKKEGLLWNSGKTESEQSVNVSYNGSILKSMERAYWQVRIWDNKNKVSEWSEPAYWEMGILEPQTWKSSFIGLKQGNETGKLRPCQYFRKEFSFTKKVKSARLYITSLGLYQVFINGQKVSSDLFTPGWTSYNKRLQYQTYDVSSMLKDKTSIGAILGDGWYRGSIGWGQNNYYGDRLALLLQLKIDYVDGTSDMVTTGQGWKVTTGPILTSEIYHGETYDAQLEMPGWNQPGFDDSKWNEAVIIDHGKDMLISSVSNPVKAIKEIKPVKLFKTPKGETVFDMGQNMVGWVRLKVKGNKGDQIILKFAEVLDKAGNFYTENLRVAKSTDTYILRGGGDEVFEPHFTFHGFRFVKMDGFSGTPGMDQITGVVIHTNMEPTGTFSCSDSMINKLQHNIQWGQKGNFLDIPTDCPQRDERLGWTGDAQVFAPTAAFNFNVAPFYTKWLKDVAADQLPSGRLPHVIPDVLHGDGGSAAWADASVIIPWTVYITYGDSRILKDQYASMKAWVEYMKGRAGDSFIWSKDFHFGDWLAYATTNSDYPGATTEKDLIATAYYFYSTSLLSKTAKIIGNKADEEAYAALAEKIKAAFNNEFVTPAGRLVSHTQTAYVLALSFGLLPDNLVSKAALYLADDVKKFGHLTTGFVGTPLLCQALSDHGYADVAYMLLNNKKYPSWLYPITQGATTIWERWDGQKPDGSFQDVGMNSFNHYAYGAIGEWLYSYVAGINIDPTHPGYQHFSLSPHPGGTLHEARAKLLTMYGSIESSWELAGGNMVYEITIPANTTATVILPQAKKEQLTLNAKPLQAEMKEGAQQSTDNVKLELGSGKYYFKYPVSI
jgi:alpha-L-rhamnosidase